MRFSGAEKIASTLKKKQEKMKQEKMKQEKIKQARHSSWMEYLAKFFVNLGYGMGINIKKILI